VSGARIVGAGAAVVAFALLAAGCGGSDNSASGTTSTTSTTATAEWADSFCSAFQTWKDELNSITDRFTSLSSFSQDNLQTAADDAKSATDQLLTDLQGLGAPDTASGQEVKDSIDSLSTTLQSELDAIEKTVQDTSGIAELPGAVADVSASIATMTTAFSSTTSTIEDADASGELKDAIDNSSACSGLTS
jgi:hypothetical protein